VERPQLEKRGRAVLFFLYPTNTCSVIITRLLSPGVFLQRVSSDCSPWKGLSRRDWASNTHSVAFPGVFLQRASSDCSPWKGLSRRDWASNTHSVAFPGVFLQRVSSDCLPWKGPSQRDRGGVWHKKLKKTAFGEFSFAMYEANYVMEDTSQVGQLFLTKFELSNLSVILIPLVCLIQKSSSSLGPRVMEDSSDGGGKFWIQLPGL
jgi:hypothetical protein